MLQFDLRLLVKKKRKKYNSATVTCQQRRRRARHAGWATSTFRQRVNRKRDGEGVGVDWDGEVGGGGDDEHRGQEDEVGRGHELVYWERKNGKHVRQDGKCQMHAAKYKLYW